jgi:hypothetical protein
MAYRRKKTDWERERDRIIDDVAQTLSFAHMSAMMGQKKLADEYYAEFHEKQAQLTRFLMTFGRSKDGADPKPTE